MKIRTITTGFNLKATFKEIEFRRIAEFNKKTKEVFEKKGYHVQTIRTTTQPWEEYFESKEKIIKLTKELDNYTHKYDVGYFNIGTTYNPRNIPLIYDIIRNTSNGFCSVFISDEKQIDYEAASETAKLIKQLSKIRNDGFSNLRFAAVFNTKPGCPFYPSSYHKGETSFAIGTQNSDLVYKAFSKSKNLKKASQNLNNILTDEYKKIEKIAEQTSKKENVRYGGIDVSISTSVEPNESIAYAFEKLGLGKFGEVGTITIARIITDILSKIDVKKCGYSGLMLPVLEDHGLAKRNIEGTYNLTDLLLFSSVCGTGLDTIPLPGNISEEKIYALLIDIASLSIKLKKPLSARLMPIPGKKAGEITEYDFEYFVNSKIMNI
jgi:uncharacterized protein (UPF0210 family)